jgi:cytochrome c peroxidase
MVATDDSVLGSLSASPSPGLTTSYDAMVRAAIQPAYIASTVLTQDGFTQMEANFSLVFGLAVMMYESTLVPNQTPFDQFAEGNRSALSSSAQRGMNLFNGNARCNHCHTGATFSAATSGTNGFVNIGVSPTAEDGGQQPQNQGKFKIPSLRDAELTGPYFHKGKFLTLRQVVEFYNRGGDFANPEIDSQIRPLGLSSTDKDDLVSFLLSLTDERVRFERAPFDHPQLSPPNGPSLSAVGAGGNATPVGTYLGADPRAQ